MKPQALIVEDNVLNSEILHTLLESSGFDVVSIPSPRNIEAAVARMQNLRVVFLDLEFPNANGFEAYRQLIAKGWDTAIPIIAYTVHISEIDVARQMGFQGFIGKPLNPEQFPAYLERILNGEPLWALP